LAHGESGRLHTATRNPPIRSTLTLAILAFVAAFLTAVPLRAASDAGVDSEPLDGNTRGSLRINAQPLFGRDTPAAFGWVPYVVTLTNVGITPIEGNAQLESSALDSEQRSYVHAEAPFSLSPGEVVRLELLMHDAGSNAVLASATAPDGTTIARVDAGGTTPLEPMLVDLNQPSLVGALLGGTPLLTRYIPTSYGRYSSPSLAIATLETDPKGNVVLPRHAAGYASATLVLGQSSHLLALDAKEQAALTDWVLAGGSLALTLDRPSDASAPLLVALLGGAIERRTEALDLGASFLVPSPKLDGNYRLGVARRTVAPSKNVTEEMALYQGANLHSSPWGSSASYGLGEVHLLAFDPQNPKILADDWAQLKIQTLVAYAWDRNAQLAFPIGSTGFEDRIGDEIRGELDTNRGQLGIIVLLGLLLIGYAILVGPVNFQLARRSGRVFTALWRIPLGAALASVVILTVGLGHSGSGGRSHRLTLIEAGAGMARGAAVRYRAFLSAQTEDLQLTKSDAAGLFDVVGQREIGTRSLVIIADEIRLEHFPHRPWQTLVVREDGVLDLGKGISIQAQGSDLAIRNDTANDLIAVVLHVPGGELRFFPRITVGDRALASKGEIVAAGAGTAVRSVHELSLATFRHPMSKASPGADRAWSLLAQATRRAVDWWPADVPVVIAELDMTGQGQDAGLPVEIDRTLIRVVGYGGSP
jgi:hypothetical protein